jgi:hypothetical protein
MIATAFRELLGRVFPSMEEPFHSGRIPGGSDWRQALTTSLDQCEAIIFCFTPEATTSGWVLYEAGYMAAKGAEIRPFIYGATVPEPLRNLQAVELNWDQVSELIERLAELADLTATERHSYRARFDQHWPAFQDAICSIVLFQVKDFVPAEHFSELFNRKTFREPFPECVDGRWLDRYNAVARARQSLGNHATRQALTTDEYVKGAFGELGRLLDRYQMLIGGALLREVAWDDVPHRHQQLLERCRQDIVRLVRDFDKPSHLPIFPESIAYAAADTEARKETIHALETRIGHNEIDSKAISEAMESSWDLDRIVAYVAWQKGKCSSSLRDRVNAIRREEEVARTRELVTGLQPLYYALEAFDDLLPGEDDIDRGELAGMASSILGTICEVDRFITERDDRDRGGQISRRVESIRSKVGTERRTPPAGSPEE